jgi:hypothetical protein
MVSVFDKPTLSIQWHQEGKGNNACHKQQQ